MITKKQVFDYIIKGYGFNLIERRLITQINWLSHFILEPDGAPQDVSAHNSSSTSILVTWDDVPVQQQNGIITRYTITYQSQTENHNGNVSADPSDRQLNITGLKEYVFYNITMFASTVKGDGPHSTPVVVVRTDQDSK